MVTATATATATATVTATATATAMATEMPVSLRLSNVGEFFGVELLETKSKFRMSRKNLLCCVYILCKTLLQEGISCHCHKKVTKRCTEKCAACAKLSFWLLNLMIFYVLVAVTVVHVP